jgi:hypothetical protein
MSLTRLQQKAVKLKEELDLLSKEIFTIQTKKKKLSKQFENLEEYYPKVEALRTKADHKEIGLNATIEFIAERKDYTLKFLKEIRTNFKSKNAELEKSLTKFNHKDKGFDSLLTQSQNHNQKIIELKNAATKMNGDIETSKISAESYLEEVKNITEIITDTGLANYFQNRRKSLNKAVVFWTIVFFIGFSVFGITGYYIFRHTQGEFGLEAFFMKISYIIPSSALMIYAIRRASEERIFLEKYAFKEVIAGSIKSYTKLLTEVYTSSDDKNRILDFTLDTMNTIFKEPYQDKKNTNIKISLDPNTKAIAGEFLENYDINVNKKSKSKSKPKQEV